MPKTNDVRWITREHTGTVGHYLLVDCGNPDCGFTNTLAALVDGEVHMRAARKCQQCGEALSLSEKDVDAELRSRQRGATKETKGDGVEASV